MPATEVVIALGANLGDRFAQLENARAALADAQQVRRISTLYETAPVGGPPQGPYLNGALALETQDSPQTLLAQLLAIEARFGRERRVRYGPRTLDLDILFFGSKHIDTPALEVPHPRVFERPFAWVPAREVLSPALARAVMPAALRHASHALAPRYRPRPHGDGWDPIKASLS